VIGRHMAQQSVPVDLTPSDPLISVVIISYNQGEYLAATIQSVVSQTYQNKEIILIDGASEDSSVDVIKKYSEYLSYWISEKDNGQSDAIQKGFQRAQGSIIGWVNSDDLLHPDTLSLVSRKAKERHVTDAVFYGGYEWIDEEGKVVERFKSELHVSCVARKIGANICQPGTFFGRQAYRRVGGIDSSLRYAMDRDLFLRFANSPVPFLRIDKPLAQFRKTRTQKGHSHEYALLCQKETEELDNRYRLVTGVRSAPYGALRQVLRLATNYYPHTWLFRMRQGRVRPYSVYRPTDEGLPAAARPDRDHEQ